MTVDGAPPRPNDRIAGAHGLLSVATRYKSGDSYTSFVGWMKILLPGTAIILLSLALMWPVLMDNTKSTISGAKKVFKPADIKAFEMRAPRFIGVDDNNRPYKMTARIARRDPLKPNLISLVEPKANMTLEKGAWAALSAKAGLFHQKKRILTLTGNVNAYHDSGYTFKTERAVINIRENSARGDRPVTGNGPRGKLRAQGFRIIDKGKTVLFLGRTHVVLNVNNQDMKEVLGPGKGRPPAGKKGAKKETDKK